MQKTFPPPTVVMSSRSWTTDDDNILVSVIEDINAMAQKSKLPIVFPANAYYAEVYNRCKGRMRISRTRGSILSRCKVLVETNVLTYNEPYSPHFGVSYKLSGYQQSAVHLFRKFKNLAWQYDVLKTAFANMDESYVHVLTSLFYSIRDEACLSEDKKHCFYAWYDGQTNTLYRYDLLASKGIDTYSAMVRVEIPTTEHGEGFVAFLSANVFMREPMFDRTMSFDDFAKQNPWILPPENA